LTKIRGLGGQVGQMKQLTAQLKKDKDVAAEKVSELEKRIVDSMNKIQVRDLQFARDIRRILACRQCVSESQIL